MRERRAREAAVGLRRQLRRAVPDFVPGFERRPVRQVRRSARSRRLLDELIRSSSLMFMGMAPFGALFAGTRASDRRLPSFSAVMRRQRFGFCPCERTHEATPHTSTFAPHPGTQAPTHPRTSPGE
jgi:hypothetical protein